MVQETYYLYIDPCGVFNYGGTKDFTIEIRQPYCNSGPTTTLDAHLGLVQLLGDTGGIFLSINCPGPIGPQRSFETASLVRGNTYTLTVNVTSCSSTSFPQITGIWIDLDNNGQYTDKDLLGTTNEYGLNDIRFTIPLDGYIGNTSLRTDARDKFH